MARLTQLHLPDADDRINRPGRVPINSRVLVIRSEGLVHILLRVLLEVMFVLAWAWSRLNFNTVLVQSFVEK